MTQIKLDFFQIIILIVFIYVFTYFWLPKNNENKTEQYLKLLDKYNKILDDKKKYKFEYNKLLNSYNIQNTRVGKSISAHSGSTIPRNFSQTDNQMVDEILN